MNIIALSRPDLFMPTSLICCGTCFHFTSLVMWWSNTSRPFLEVPGLTFLSHSMCWLLLFRTYQPISRTEIIPATILWEPQAVWQPLFLLLFFFSHWTKSVFTLFFVFLALFWLWHTSSIVTTVEGDQMTTSITMLTYMEHCLGFCFAQFCILLLSPILLSKFRSGKCFNEELHRWLQMLQTSLTKKGIQFRQAICIDKINTGIQ